MPCRHAKLPYRHSQQPFTGGADGLYPGPLSIDQQGNVYGTTGGGGDLTCAFPGGCGTVFTIALPSVRISGSVQAPLARDSHGNFVALVTITNSGNIALDTAQVTTHGTTLGSSALLSSPSAVTNLSPGASATVVLAFPATAAKNGATTAPLKVSVTYSVSSMLLSGGNWTLSFRGVSLKQRP